MRKEKSETENKDHQNEAKMVSISATKRNNKISIKTEERENGAQQAIESSKRSPTISLKSTQNAQKLLVTSIMLTLANQALCNKFPITVIKDGQIQTDLVLECRQDTCFLDQTKLVFNHSLTIKNNWTASTSENPTDPLYSLSKSHKDINSQLYTKLVFDSVRFEEKLSQNATLSQNGIFTIWVVGFDVTVKSGSSIFSSVIKVIVNSLNVSQSTFNYGVGWFMADSFLILDRSSVSNLNNYCSTSTFDVFTSNLFQSYLTFDCSSDFSMFRSLKQIVIEVAETEILPKASGFKATVVFCAQNITLSSTSSINGNILIVSDELSILDGTVIDTLASGCGFNGSPGTPILFASQSYSCGLNGGSYGGRGGVGINTVQIQQNLDCLKQSYSKMRVYGYPWNPSGSGATGSSFNPNQRSDPYIAPGAVVVFTLDLTLEGGSVIQAGYELNEKRKAIPANSGGSVMVYYKTLSMDSESCISANGQSSDSAESGAGGGGRIFLNNYCWFNMTPAAPVEADLGENGGLNRSQKNRVLGDLEEAYAPENARMTSEESPRMRGLRYSQMKKNNAYNFNKSQIMARSGIRPNFKPYIDMSLYSIIKASPGTILTSPCYYGTSGTDCQPCAMGHFKWDLLEQTCSPCEFHGLNSAIYLQQNNCEQFKCNPKTVELNKNINPYCLPTATLFTQSIAINRWGYIVVYTVVISIFVLFEIRGSPLFSFSGRARKRALKRAKRSNDRSRKSQSMVSDESEMTFDYEKDIYFISLQGRNTHDDPWFLDLDISKEFKCIFSKMDYFNLTRVSFSSFFLEKFSIFENFFFSSSLIFWHFWNIKGF